MDGWDMGKHVIFGECRRKTYRLYTAGARSDPLTLISDVLLGISARVPSENAHFSAIHQKAASVLSLSDGPCSQSLCMSERAIPISRHSALLPNNATHKGLFVHMGQ